jgi:hypothetical protein
MFSQSGIAPGDHREDYYVTEALSCAMYVSAGCAPTVSRSRLSSRSIAFLFAIHSKVEILKRDGHPLGTYARHYYDLFQLAAQPEVAVMLNAAEYTDIKTDYDQIGRTHFARSYFCPEDMSFSRSEALFPPATLAATIGAEYEAQCKMLCYSPYPSWADIQACFLSLRHLL